jgi:protein-S-isoprenylcysteine O-methyltransferase Ste14
MKLFIRALASFLLLPGIVAGLVPFLILGGHLHPSRAGLPGFILLCAGFVLLLWCARDFYVSGRGTLAPWDPPRNLVVVGLYRFTRNPMYVAVLMLLAGWATAFGSLPLGGYFLCVAAAVHLRVVLAEEPWLSRTFGAEWVRYARSVPRWIPRIGGGKGA